MKWICTVCGYVHEGDSPPDVCPVCGQGKEVFKKAEDLPKEKATAPAKEDSQKGGPKSNRWRCTVCNYIHEGPEPPGVCPICGAGKEAFVAEVESPEHHHRGFGGIIEKLHLHPVSAHFPNGALPLAFLAWLVYLVLGDNSFERTSFYLMLVATMAVPFTGLTGWSDAKHRFGTTTTGVFPEKKIWSVVLAVVMLSMAGWRLSLGWNHVPSGAEIVVYTVLLGAATGIVARLGMLGGKLVFGH